ncbi:hypothetical protein pdam_00023087 [Pocillopora damicornis]|uniref:Vacuolar protein-sorting-associated protein 25 n=1 Tax=Pocillopora damicornis TaxID=46731 RepID=A0A3M6UI58_POCDA|nr:hypothetical protein pdam_00023087 [Pocillopora damicornis]
MAKTFEWPWQYNFPPFFTLQTNLDTRRKQIEGWCNLVLAFYKYHKRYVLDIPPLPSPLWGIEEGAGSVGKLSLETINLILEELQSKGNIEWEDKKKQRCFVMWRTPDEWAALIFKWVQENGMTDTVCTLFELRAGDDTVNEEFYGIDMWMLKKALGQLELKGKAQMFEAPDATDDSGQGVKFFS